MFQFYANLLSLDAKHVWNKIVREHTEADPFKDLQGVSRKGPRGFLLESFNKCVMFHLLTVFPNNAAEQEKCWKSGLNPLDPRCLLLVITPGTLPCTMGALDHIVVPKIKTKIVLTVGDYLKRVSYLSNFANAVWLLVIP
jgi:hypothetical protein